MQTLYSDEFIGRNDDINLQKTCFTRMKLPAEKGPFQESLVDSILRSCF